MRKFLLSILIFLPSIAVADPYEDALIQQIIQNHYSNSAPYYDVQAHTRAYQDEQIRWQYMQKQQLENQLLTQRAISNILGNSNSRYDAPKGNDSLTDILNRSLNKK